MAANTKFAFTTAEGKVETRSSARAYTHVVVGRYNVAAHRAHIEAEHAKPAKHTRSNYEFHSKRAAMQPGDQWHSTFANGTPYSVTLTEKDIECCREALHGATTLAEYNIALRARALDDLHTRYGEADIGAEAVLQWSQSVASAQKSVGQWSKHWAQVRVVAL